MNGAFEKRNGTQYCYNKSREGQFDPFFVATTGGRYITSVSERIRFGVTPGGFLNSMKCLLTFMIARCQYKTKNSRRALLE